MANAIYNDPTNGGNCNSVDWWYSSFQCHLSEGTSCDNKTYNKLAGTIASSAYGPAYQVADYYEKYCICGLADNNPTATTELAYNPALAGTVIYD